jgi:uncharacterized protein YPO0396
MALTPAEIKAKRIASKQKQIATKLAQIAKIQDKRTAKQSLQAGYAAMLNSDADLRPNQIASLTKKNNAAIAMIAKYNATIDRYEAQRMVYAQELAALIGPQ